MLNKKKHAKHNEEACDYLHAHGEFRDWVVTTAYYSLIHYIEHEIFPLTVEERTYPTFNAYFFDFLIPKAAQEEVIIKKHEELVSLVKEKIPPAYEPFRWIYNLCMNARYNDYRVSRKYAKATRDYLNDIKKELKKN